MYSYCVLLVFVGLFVFVSFLFLYFFLVLFVFDFFVLKGLRSFLNLFFCVL